MLNTFYELAIRMAIGDKEMIDAVLEDAKFVGLMPMEETTHGLLDMYEELASISGVGLVDLDAVLPEIGIDTVLKQCNLSVLGGKIFCPEDKARKFGGFEKYVARHLRAVLHDAGMNYEQTLFYNTLRAFAFINGKLQSVGGTSNKNYTMMCVTFVPGQNSGLYDPEGFGKGMAFDMKAINGGNLYEDPATKKLGYGMRLKSYVGMRMANARYIDGLVNIDLDDDGAGGYKALPSIKQINSMITRARATPGRSMIVCRPEVRDAISEHKAASLRTSNSDKGLNTVIDNWNDIPIIPSYCLLGGDDGGEEPNVTIS